MDVIDRIARRQWGLVTHSQLAEVISKAQIRTLRADGKLIDVHRGVYRTFGSPMNWQQTIVAAQMACAVTAPASFDSAARLHGLVVPTCSDVHLTLPPTASHQAEWAVLHRTELPSKHIVRRFGIACTSVERTLVDLSTKLSEVELARAIDEAIIARKTSFVAVDRVFVECGSRGRRRAATLRRLLDERLPLPATVSSVIELRLAKAIRRAALPLPDTHLLVGTRLGPYEIDVAWPRFRLGAEADGCGVHSASRRRHTRDRRRRNELETMGWRILNFTYDMTIAEMAAVLLANIPRRSDG